MTADDALPLIAEGDRDAFAPFYDELAGAVFGTVRRVLRDPAMSEEVTQEVFVELWRTAPRFDPERGSAMSWAVTVARRRAVDRVRREQSQRERVERLASQEARAANGDDVARTVHDSMQADRVRAAIATLPDDQQQVIELAFLEGRAHGAIAEQLGLPLGTVKGRVRGGLKRLRAALGTER